TASFTVVQAPASGGTASPSVLPPPAPSAPPPPSRGREQAWSRASSPLRTQNAFSLALCRSMRSRYMLTSSRAETSRPRTAAACSRADANGSIRDDSYLGGWVGGSDQEGFEPARA